MKRIFLNLIVWLLLVGCNDQGNQTSDNNSVTLHGKIKFPETGWVVLEEYGVQQVTPIDTLEVQADGQFQYRISLDEPGFYRLNLYGKQMVDLILDQDDLNIEVDGNNPAGVSSVTGSKDMQYLKEINEMVQAFQQQVSSMNAKYVQANTDQDQQEMERIKLQFDDESKQYKAKLKEKVAAMGNSLAVLQVIGNFNAEEDYEFLNNLGEIFANDPPESKHTPRFLTYIDGVRQQYKNGEKLQLVK